MSVAERQVYKLKFPIQHGSETITEFSLRRFKAKDMRGFASGMSDEDKLLKLISRMAGQPDIVVDELDGVDLIELGQFVTGFFPNGLGTGTTP